MIQSIQKGRKIKMLQTTIKGYKITIFKHYNGTQLFISDKNGVQIYAHKVSSNPIERAKEVIAQQ